MEPVLFYHSFTPRPCLWSRTFTAVGGRVALKRRSVRSPPFDDAGASSMFDLVLVVAGIGFFGMMLIYAGICERL